MTYKFFNYNSSDVTQDPVFDNKNFKLFGDPSSFDGPELYHVDKYSYALCNPEKDKNNKELMFKIATYLYHHPTSLNNKLVTYFFGELNDCQNISDGFTNQVVKIVTYEMLDEWYPKNLEEVNSKIINYFINKQSFYGKKFILNDYDRNFLFFIPKTLNVGEQSQSFDYIKSQLFSNGYLIKGQCYDNKIEFTLSNIAIEKYQKNEFTKNYSKKKCFIAIKFGGNEERIKTIQSAIAECNFESVIMSEYETNNWIMPEIFHQIKLCDFMVVDLSVRCDGAYYEAGYAYALGKEVIHTYDLNEKENNPLHFDVAQKSTVMYNNYEELKKKLVARIKATID